MIYKLMKRKIFLANLKDLETQHTIWTLIWTGTTGWRIQQENEESRI